MALTLEEEQELAELEAKEAAMLRRSAAKKPQAPQIGETESYFRGMTEAMIPGSKYPGAAGRYLRGQLVGPELTFEEAIADEEEMARRAREEQPLSYYKGMGTGILGAGTAGVAMKVPSFLKALGTSMAGGALYEMGSEPYQEIKEEPERLIGAGVKGAAKGGLLPVGAQVIAKRAPVVEGAKAAYEATKGKDILPAIPAAVGTFFPAAIGTSKATQEMKDVVQKIAPQTPVTKPDIGQYLKYGSTVAPEEEAQFLLNLLQPGKTPAKEFYTQKATQLFEDQIGPKQLEQVLDIPLEQRVQAREFDRSDVGRQLLPQAQAAKKILSGKGKTFEELQNKAIQEYEGKGLPEVFMALDKAKATEFSGVSQKARRTVNEVLEILEEGKSLDEGRLMPGDIMDVGNQESYKRLQAAREWIDQNLDASIDDPAVAKILKPIRREIDAALKSSPSKVLADQLYKRGVQVEQVAIQPLEMTLGKGKMAPRELSSAQIKNVFGDTVKGEKAQRGIEMARSYAQDFAKELGPENSKIISEFFDALADARSVSERKRIIDSLKFSGGPSSPAIRAGIKKLEQTLKPAPGGASMFQAAPEYLQNIDAFMADQARRQFNKPFDKLTAMEQLKLINAYQWRKENPNATLQEINEAFTRILKGSKK